MISKYSSIKLVNTVTLAIINAPYRVNIPIFARVFMVCVRGFVVAMLEFYTRKIRIYSPVKK
jgi:hypothetical protein